VAGLFILKYLGCKDSRLKKGCAAGNSFELITTYLCFINGFSFIFKIIGIRLPLSFFKQAFINLAMTVVKLKKPQAILQGILVGCWLIKYYLKHRLCKLTAAINIKTIHCKYTQKLY